MYETISSGKLTSRDAAAGGVDHIVGCPMVIPKGILLSVICAASG